MQGQSYQVKNVPEQYDIRNKTFLDIPGNPLGGSLMVKMLSKQVVAELQVWRAE